MQKKWMGKFRRVLEVLGDDPRTSVVPTPWSRSSSPTRMASGSPPQSLNGSSVMPPLTGAMPSSSSSSQHTRFDSSVASRGHGEERDVTLVLHLSMYATDEQVIQSSESLLRILEVKGFAVTNATCNGNPIHAAKP